MKLWTLLTQQPQWLIPGLGAIAFASLVLTSLPIQAAPMHLHQEGSLLAQKPTPRSLPKPLFPRTTPPKIARGVSPLPKALGHKLLSSIAKAQGIPVSQLKLAAVRSRTWDGCLGVAGPDQFCPMIAISGWQVIVAGPQQYWVYHLNQTGSQIKLNPTTSAKGTAVPTFWQLDANGLAADAGDDAVFQSISSGGFAGRTEKTVLFKDGRVLRMSAQPNARFMPVLVRQLSPQQVQQFGQTLQQQEFSDFLGFSYPAQTGAADYFTIVLMVPQGATQYVDINQDQTPLKLQQVIQAWNQIAR